MLRTNRTLLTFGFCLILQTTPGLGQGTLSLGTIDATSHLALEDGVPFRIRLPDRSASSIETAKLFTAELKKKGYSPSDTGTGYTLAFKWTSDVAIEPEPYPMVELRPRDRNPSYDEEADRLFRLGQRDIDTAPFHPRSMPRILLVEVLNKRAQLVWSARATALIATDDPGEIAATLVPRLVHRLGQTVYDEELK